MLAALLASCSVSVTDPVLECEGQQISLAMYEFMLARMKGALAKNKYDVSAGSEFWSEIHGGTDKTNEQYYHDVTLDNCKNYLAALVLFEQEGLTLPQSVLDAIEEELSFYIDYDGQGDEEKLDAILSKYGVDTEQLRRIYTVEAKYEYLIAELYGSDASLISDTVKEDHYRENYLRFKQILVSNFYYEYQKDEQGNVIYFDPEDSKPIYDTENGVYHYDGNGSRIRDSYGEIMCFDSDGNILYDKENGYPAATLDESGEAIRYYYTDAQMQERVAQMQQLLDEVGAKNYSAFESKMPEWELFESPDEYYADGYYLSAIESAAYEDYMLDILKKLGEMNDGDVEVVESDYGYHVVMKYPLDKSKYSDADYAEWFASFNSSLINKLFLDKCASFYGKIEINTDNLDKARSIKSISSNFDY
jgi:hypothetical protein